jgi:hypothetical protein
VRLEEAERLVRLLTERHVECVLTTKIVQLTSWLKRPEHQVIAVFASDHELTAIALDLWMQGFKMHFTPEQGGFTFTPGRRLLDPIRERPADAEATAQEVPQPSPYATFRFETGAEGWR